MEAFLRDESGADDHIGGGIDESLDEFWDIGSLMLAIAIELDGNIVLIFPGIDIASLDSGADTEVTRQVESCDLLLVREG